MTQKNETPVLILSLLIVVAALVGGGWWLLSQIPGSIFASLGKQSPGTTNQFPTSPGGVQSSPSLKFSDVKTVPEGLFNYGGSTTWAPIRQIVDPQIEQAFPNFRLRYTHPIGEAPGSGTGIVMLLDGQLSFSQSSRPIKPEEYQQAQQRGFTLEGIPVAIDGIAVAVNPSLNVPGLTLEQLQGIYTGKITNWREVGGPDLGIVPYSRREADSGTVEFFVSEILKKAPFGQTVQFISTTTEALRSLGQTPGGIYYASAPEVVPQCTIKPLALAQASNQAFIQPYAEPYVSSTDCPNRRNQLNITAMQSGNYPITRRLFVVVKKNGQLDQQAGEVYAQLLLTDEGQRSILQSGFVPIR
jgi:phosphate transport system substrate-binding protein